MDATARTRNFKRSFEVNFAAAYTETDVWYPGEEFDTTSRKEWLEINYLDFGRDDWGNGNGGRTNNSNVVIEANVLVKESGSVRQTQADRADALADIVIDILNNRRISLMDYVENGGSATEQTIISLGETQQVNLPKREDGIQTINLRVSAQWEGLFN